MYFLFRNSEKHLPQSPFTRQFFPWRHFALVSINLIGPWFEYYVWNHVCLLAHPIYSSIADNLLSRQAFNFLVLSILQLNFCSIFCSVIGFMRIYTISFSLYHRKSWHFFPSGWYTVKKTVHFFCCQSSSANTDIMSSPLFVSLSFFLCLFVWVFCL